MLTVLTRHLSKSSLCVRRLRGDVMSWLPKHLGNPGVDVRGRLDAAVIGGNIDS